jgi:hypothetical protein
MTTPSTDEALQPLQREVQRLLGRCLLRLQQYERLMKAIVAHHDISGPGLIELAQRRVLAQAGTYPLPIQLAQQTTGAGRTAPRWAWPCGRN